MEPKQARVSATAELTQILVANQRSFHQFPEVECGLEDLCRIPFFTHVSGVKSVQATSTEHIPGEWGHNDSEVLFC
jgi:hypothetical protein